MLQNNTFSGQPVFSQILGLVNKASFNHLVGVHDADRYTKRCGAWEHFACMMYCIMNNCTSLREVTHGMAAYGDKLNHLGLDYTPPRSTLGDANQRRDEAFFGDVYGGLYRHFQKVLSDSPAGNELLKRLFVIDSTTISLFQAIMKSVGRKPADGKAKGGIKVHTMINAYEEVPQLVRFTDASAHDVPFLKDIHLKPHQIALFDKGYVDYGQYARFGREQVCFVTRLREGAVYEQLEEIDLPEGCPDGYLKDEWIKVSYKDEAGAVQPLKLRRVVFYDTEKDYVYQFLTNIPETEMGAQQIGDLYKKRWQIELLFKQLKQNFPLKYFLGDSPNAIKIQIWCTLTANLLFTVIKRNLKRKISFSVLVSFARQHLFSYNRLVDLIERAEHEWRNKNRARPVRGPSLFDG